MFHASMAAAFAMAAAGRRTPLDARRGLDGATRVAIAASVGIGEAIRVSGTDRLLAEGIVAAGASHPRAALAAMNVATAALTELITNNAAAALTFAASASFSTPVGHPTNLMVYGPGGHCFGDYFRLGIPPQVPAATVTLPLIPLAFPFRATPRSRRR